MKTLLIVEDEKAIRMGIRAMVQRAPVPVESVVECKNGVEALDILQSQHVDVMITDIRMPRMDGIELVNRVNLTPSPPLIVVISGYDEFSYAVNMFRQGVRDYLLKPVERERIFELLAKLDAEIAAIHRKKEDNMTVSRHVLRSLMLGGRMSAGELETLAGRYSGSLIEGDYTVACLPRNFKLPPQPGKVYVLRDVEEHTVLLAECRHFAELKQTLLKDCCAGFSKSHSGLLAIPRAYRQAAQARKAAFVRGTLAEYVDQPEVPDSDAVLCKLEQIIHLLGASRVDEAQNVLGHILFLAQNGKVSPEAFVKGMGDLIHEMRSTYGSILDAGGELGAFTAILGWKNAFDYYTALCDWMERVLIRLPDTDAERNRQSILEALAYLQKHYRVEVNMAMASNYVSMNYTQFSYLFKRYTGNKFSDYLKNLRIEEGKRLLRDTDLSIRLVSEHSGFKNEKHFMKSFKHSVGVSPGDYRRNCRIMRKD